MSSTTGKVFARMVFTVAEQEYPLAMREDETLGLTPREHGDIRRICGVSGTRGITDGISQLDGELFAALAIVAARRAGVELDADKLLDGVTPMRTKLEEDAPADPPIADAGAGSPSADTSPDTSPIPVTSGHP